MSDTSKVSDIFFSKKTHKIYAISFFNPKLATHNLLLFNNLQNILL